jgi:hypothetical protein
LRRGQAIPELSYQMLKARVDRLERFSRTLREIRLTTYRIEAGRVICDLAMQGGCPAKQDDEGEEQVPLHDE